jgi:hypothetical protein
MIDGLHATINDWVNVAAVRSELPVIRLEIGLCHLANGKTIIKTEYASAGLFHLADHRE